MAVTRHNTGNSRPRVFPTVDTAPATTRKRATKPKSKKTATGRIAKVGAAVTGKNKPKKKKSPASATTTTATAPAVAGTGGSTTTTTTTVTAARKPGVVDKVKGALKKVEGAVTGKSGKKAAGTAKMRGTDGKKKTTTATTVKKP